MDPSRGRDKIENMTITPKRGALQSLVTHARTILGRRYMDNNKIAVLPEGVFSDLRHLVHL